jgi:hypothetical protein
MQWARAAKNRECTARELGQYIAQLASWSWFGTFTFRRRPAQKWALAELNNYLQDLGTAAARDIGWVFVEDFGVLDRRYHVHLLIAGVDQFSSRKWEIEAGRRFGLSEIQLYDPEQGAAYYIAQKAVYEDRDMHFGGKLLRRARKVEKTS